MPFNPGDLDPKKMTSDQAAALILSDGKTADPVKAQLMADGAELDMELLERAALRRYVGCDFGVQILPNVALFTTKEQPYVRVRVKYKDANMIDTDPATAKRMDMAFTKLRDKWEAEKARLRNTNN